MIKHPSCACLIVTLIGIAATLAPGQTRLLVTGYSVSLDDNALYEINLHTGDATHRGQVRRQLTKFIPRIYRGVIELEFTPDGKLFGVDRNHESLIQINPANGRVLQELPIHGDIDHIPEHVGMSWYTDSKLVIENTPEGPVFRIIEINSLAMVVGGLAGETDAMYLLDHNTGEAELSSILTQEDGDPDPFFSTVVAMRQINPLLPFPTGGIPQPINDDGTVGVGNSSPIGSGGFQEAGLANYFDDQGQVIGAAYITSPFIPDEPEFNIALRNNDGSSSSFASTDDTSGVGNFQSLAIAQDEVFEIIPGDANLDGLVDVIDLGIVSANWGLGLRQFVTGDFNDDSQTNVADLAMLAANWSMSNSLSFADALAASGLTIPEPGSAVAIMLGLGLLALRRQDPRGH